MYIPRSGTTAAHALDKMGMFSKECEKCATEGPKIKRE
jgi:hypothetical protein